MRVSEFLLWPVGRAFAGQRLLPSSALGGDSAETDAWQTEGKTKLSADSFLQCSALPTRVTQPNAGQMSMCLPATTLVTGGKESTAKSVSFLIEILHSDAV